MSTLTRSEKTKLEKVFEMSGGYVLDFSNRTFHEFVLESVGVDIYDAKYTQSGNSKAKVLRAFWDAEPDTLVGKLLLALFEHWKTREVTTFRLTLPEEKALLKECEKIPARLLANAGPVVADAFKPREDDKTFAALSRSIRDSLDQNQPEAALDRLHTYVVRYVRELCVTRAVTCDKDKALHSAFGELVKALKKNGEIESEMTERILRSSISVMESFNEIRNNRSLAHDNPLLSYQESILIFSHMSGVITFLEALEKKRVDSQRLEPGIMFL